MVSLMLVAPHWGAWIEIRAGRIRCPVMVVAPHWGAWIEIHGRDGTPTRRKSHPTGVRGLKLPEHVELLASRQSHPTGVRGLKYSRSRITPAAAGSRTPLGCVD